MSNLKKIIKEIITECLNEIQQEKSSTNGVDLYDLLKTTSFISYIDKPSGKYYNHIDLKLKDETHLKMLDDFLNNHNWYIRDGHNMNYTISQTYVDDGSAYKGSFYIQNIDKIPSNNIKIIEY